MPLKAELWRTHPKYHCDAGAFPSLPAASHVDLKSEPAFSRSVDEFSANGNAADVFCQRKCCASRYTDYERERKRERERERVREREREWSFAIFAVRCYFLLKQGPVSSCPCGGVLHSFSESCLAFWLLLEFSLAT